MIVTGEAPQLLSELVATAASWMKFVVVNRKKSDVGTRLCCKFNGDARLCADFLPCGGSLSAFLHWRVDATAIIGTLTQRTAVADRNRRFNAFA